MEINHNQSKKTITISHTLLQKYDKFFINERINSRQGNCLFDIKIQN